MLCDAQVN